VDRGELTPDQLARAMNEIYAAEGSDWFWWYGDEFVTENDFVVRRAFPHPSHKRLPHRRRAGARQLEGAYLPVGDTRKRRMATG